MPMDKYFSCDARFPFLAVHDFLRGMNISPRCVNFCEVCNLLTMNNSSARHEILSRCIYFKEAWNLLVMHKFLRGMKSFRDAWILPRDA